MNLPHASQSQIEAMKKKAEEQFGTLEQEEAPQQPEPAQEEEAGDPNETTLEPQEEQPVEEKRSSKEENMRILRERSERAERERDELMRKLQEMQATTTKQTTQKEIQEIKDDLNFNPEDLAEGKHLMQLVNKIKTLEKKLDESAQQTQMTTTELKIKRDFPDFDKVANYDNLRKLREADPDLADAILSTKDVYKQHALAYKMVKQMGIYREDTYSDDRERAKKNVSKPRPLTSISPQQGESPLTNANAFASGLTEELRQQLHREMLESMKNR